MESGKSSSKKTLKANTGKLQLCEISAVSPIKSQSNSHDRKNSAPCKSADAFVGKPNFGQPTFSGKDDKSRCRSLGGSKADNQPVDSLQVMFTVECSSNEEESASNSDPDLTEFKAEVQSKEGLLNSQSASKLPLKQQSLIVKPGTSASVEVNRRSKSFAAADTKLTTAETNVQVDSKPVKAVSQSKKGVKKRSLTGPIVNKFFRRRPTDTSINPAESSGKINREEVRQWETSFELLLKNKHGLKLFKQFLQQEFSDENIEFWIACDEYKRVADDKLPAKAREIYTTFVAVQAPKEVNLDSGMRSRTKEGALTGNPSRNIFDASQYRIQGLMEKDSYQRFIKSDLYTSLLKK